MPQVAIAIATEQMSGIYAVDASSGAVIWERVSTSEKSASIEGSDGKGAVLVAANPSSMDAHFDWVGDVFELDGAGGELWRDNLEDPDKLVAWPAGLPWYEASRQASVSSNGHLLLTPGKWFRGAVGDESGFVFDEATLRPGFPLGVGALRGGEIVAMYLCPIALNASDSRIDGAALLPGQLIIGRRTVLNEGCGGNQFQPFTIEA